MCSNTTASTETEPASQSFPESPSEPPTPNPAENDDHDDDDEDDSCSTSGSSQTGSTVENQENQLLPETQPDTQAEQIREAVQKLSNFPTVDTLTPATSSEDIFYSPIGVS